MKRHVVRIGVNSLYHSGAHRLFSRFFAGVGAILMFHRISDERRRRFSPNYGLSVQAKFFEIVLKGILGQGIEIVDLREACRRLKERDFRRKFVCITFDDGYRDNFQYAFPICRRLGVPMTVYVTTGFIERNVTCWWLALETALRELPHLTFRAKGRDNRFVCVGSREKQVAFDAISEFFVAAESGEREDMTVQLSQLSGMDLKTISSEQFMTWDEIKSIAHSGSVAIGGHTVSHPRLRELSCKRVRLEIADGCASLSARIGLPTEHFAYPFGRECDAGPREFAMCRELGLLTAVTTRHGPLVAADGGNLHGLPRLGVSGWHQNTATVEVLLSGATAAIASGFRRVGLV